MRRHLTALTLAGALLLGGAACSDDDGDDAGDTVDSVQEEAEDAVSTASSAIDEGATDASEAAARTIAKEQGEEQFEAAGHELEDDLECEADASEGNDSIDITCTGTTNAGGAAELTGTTSELPGASATELEGEFTGTVDGEEVFSTDTLGNEGEG